MCGMCTTIGYAKNESIPSSGKRSHKRNPSKPNKYSGQPRRKSSRRDVASARTEIEETNMSNNNILPTNILPTVEESSASNTTKSTRNRPSSAEQSKFLWHQEGQKLFDVKSEKKVMSFLKKGLCFDSDFYADQQENRQQRMVIIKVTKEFIEEDE